MLGKFNKKLDEAQMASLLSKESSQNPLWLSVACEELRVFGLFAKVTDKINSLADGLLEWVSMATSSSYLNIDLGAVSRSFSIAFILQSIQPRDNIATFSSSFLLFLILFLTFSVFSTSFSFFSPYLLSCILLFFRIFFPSLLPHVAWAVSVYIAHMPY